MKMPLDTEPREQIQPRLRPSILAGFFGATALLFFAYMFLGMNDQVMMLSIIPVLIVGMNYHVWYYRVMVAWLTAGAGTALYVMNETPRDNLETLAYITVAQVAACEFGNKLMRDRNRMKHALQESRERYRAITETAVDVILTLDAKGAIVFANERVLSMFGYSAGQAAGQPLSLLLPELEPALQDGGVGQVVSAVGPGGTGHRIQAQGRHREGHAIDVEMSFGRFERGPHQFYTVVLRDITERKQAEAELKKLSLVASQTDNAVVITDGRARIEWVNECFTRITGYTLEEVRGKNPGQVLQGEGTDPETVKTIRRHLDARQGFTGEILNFTKEGRPYWNQLSISPSFGANGEIDQFIAIQSDITARKRSEDRFRVLFEQSTDAHLIFNEQGIIECNDATVRLLRTTEKSAILMTGVAALSPAFQPDGRRSDEAHAALVREAIEKGYLQYEWVHRRFDGTCFPVEVQLSPITLGVDRAVLAVWHDLTERKAAEEALQASERRFRDIAAVAGEYIWEADCEWRYTFITEPIQTMLGLPPQEMLGLRPFDFMPAEERERMEAFLAQRMASAEPFRNVEFASVAANAKVVWQLISAEPIRDEDGDVKGYRGAGLDITERKLAEQALRESEERYHLAVSGSNDGLWDWQIQTGAVYWSPRFKALLGYEEDEIEAAYPVFLDALHPDDRDRVLAAVDLHFAQGEPFDVEYRLRTKTREYRWFRVRGQALWNEAGEPVRMAGSATDITERKAYERSLQESRAMLAEAQEMARLGNWRLDAESGHMWWSDEVCALFGHPIAYMPSNAPAFADLLHEGDGKQWLDALAAAMEGMQPVEVELQATRPDGASVHLYGHGQGVHDNAGKCIAVRGFLQDITDRKQSETEVLYMSQQLGRFSENLKTLHRVTSRHFEDAGERFMEYLAAGCRIFECETGMILRLSDGACIAEHVRTTRPGISAGTSFSLQEVFADGMLQNGATIAHRGFAQSLAMRDHPARRRFHADTLIATPIHVNDQPYGMLAFMSEAAREEPFHGHEREIIELMSQTLGSFIAANEAQRERRNAERALLLAREHEAEIGFRIQKMLLMGEPPSDVPGADIGVFTLPSQRIDGDFYDFYRHSSTCIDVLLGDVMGKGIPAALLGAAAKNYFLRAFKQLLTEQPDGGPPAPRHVVRAVHEGISSRLMGLESFITLCYARIDLERNVVTFVDCGHTKTVHLRAEDHECSLLAGDNVPLGFLASEEYREKEVPIAPGDLLFFYSDGVTEAQAPGGGYYGEERLTRLLAATNGITSEDLVHKVRGDVQRFTLGSALTDDFTCIALRIRGPEDAVNRTVMRLDVAPYMDELARVRQTVREFCTARMAPAPARELMQELELAANEAVANVIEHAELDPERDLIRVELEADADRVTIDLYHDGKRFGGAPVSVPAVDGSQESGFGLYIMRRLLDDVSYAEQGGRQRVRLTKYRTPRQDGEVTTWK